MEDNLKDMAIRHQAEREQLKQSCQHKEDDLAKNAMGGFYCTKCHTIMPSDYVSEEEKKRKKERVHKMVEDLKLEILPSGHIRFKRGSHSHNTEMKQIICQFIDGDEDVMEELNKFFEGSGDVELLIGDTIFCG